ncbi:hypothetical protein EDD85DRAFT_787127 [Armillaria nabsnona]|nr:hypothetical protein EDD85DRAFT_787127 [Armillaria nabsnona]
MARAFLTSPRCCIRDLEPFGWKRWMDADLLYSKGRVLGHKRAKRNTRPNTSLLQIEGVATKEDAQFYLGKVGLRGRGNYCTAEKGETCRRMCVHVVGVARRPHPDLACTHPPFCTPPAHPHLLLHPSAMTFLPTSHAVAVAIVTVVVGCASLSWLQMAVDVVFQVGPSVVGAFASWGRRRLTQYAWYPAVWEPPAREADGELCDRRMYYGSVDYIVYPFCAVPYTITKKMYAHILPQCTFV